ncbi:MAG: allantoicase [Bradymonadia bacterium]
MSEQRSDASGSFIPFPDLIDLACERFGGRALGASDEFFAESENLVKASDPIWIADKFTDRGKWMDGWESRRHRAPGYDWAVVALGAPGNLKAVDIDTRHFRGNHAPFGSLEACFCAEGDPGADTEWVQILAPVPLKSDAHNVFVLSKSDEIYSHVRLNNYPDGGIARLRVYGVVAPRPIEGETDLAAALAGARVLCCSDNFFSPKEQLIYPGEPEDMGGGWESRRRRAPGHDWTIVQLAQPGEISRLSVGTRHFKGNHPQGCDAEAVYWPDAQTTDLMAYEGWQPLLDRQPLGANADHHFEALPLGPITHVRLNIYPDGGLSRLRVYGRPASVPVDALGQLLNATSGLMLRDMLTRCCGSSSWVSGMMARRPFTDEASVFAAAAEVEAELTREDWLEAFSHHPRIGANVEALRQKFAATANWSEGEQAGVAGADEATLEALAEGNRAYEARYGFIFIVCASGLTAAEMLARLQERMGNDVEAELKIAAGEQAKISRLRLQKLVG